MPDKVKEAKRRLEELAAGLEERYGFNIKFNVYTYDDVPMDLLA